MAKLNFTDTRVENLLPPFLISLISSFCFIALVNHLLFAAETLIDQTTWTFSFVYLFLLSAPFLYYLLASNLALSEFGLDRKHFLISLKYSLIYIFILLFLILLIVGYLYFFDNYFLRYVFDSGELSIQDILYYFLHVSIQEFIVRGIIQSSLLVLLMKSKPYLAIFLTSLIFGFLHIHNGLLLVLISFIISLLLGFFFTNRPHLIGVILLHWTTGLLAIYFWKPLITLS